jgi:hypothetical protein
MAGNAVTLRTGPALQRSFDSPTPPTALSRSIVPPLVYRAAEQRGLVIAGATCLVTIDGIPEGRMRTPSPHLPSITVLAGYG